MGKEIEKEDGSMEKIIQTIQAKGWNTETQQLVREAVVNQPTGRFTFYDLHRCFYEDVSIEHVIQVLGELKHYSKYSPEVYKNYTPEELKRVYGNVVGDTDCHRQFSNPEELIEFWNGTSLTRAKAFLERGDGYTRLEHPVYGEGFFTQYGIQVMLEDFRAYEYARQQAYALNDMPAIIHGFIKAKYLFTGNNENEYAIPCEYYMHIQNGEIVI